MADLDLLEDGDNLSPYALNILSRELRKRRGLSGAGGIDVSGANGHSPPILSLPRGGKIFAQLTGAYASGYPWKEVVVKAGRLVVDTGLVGSSAADPAFDRRTGDTTLTAGPTVYELTRSQASNQWVFAGRPGPPPATDCPCATTMPGTIVQTATVAAGSAGYWQNASLVLGAIPGPLVGLPGMTADHWYSAGTFTNATPISPFYYVGICRGASYGSQSHPFVIYCVRSTAQTVFPFAPAGTFTAFQRWFTVPGSLIAGGVGTLPNVCSPFLFSYSFSTFGGSMGDSDRLTLSP